MDDAEQLMPVYLRFVRGVIDSNDLPLNVSREILQQSRDVQTIRAASIKRVLSLLEDLAEHHADKYATFWKEFGRVLKEGIGEDTANRERIATLFRFASTRADSDEQTVSLADYVGRMKEGQDAIYYITADSLATARHSPHLEIFRKLDVEVLLMHDPVDEWMVSMLTEFDGKPLRSVTKGGLDLSTLGGEAAKEQEKTAQSGEHATLIDRLKTALKDRASDVRVTHRLTDSPACLVADEHAMSTHLERMLKAAGQPVPASRPVLEINPQHPIVLRLAEEADDSRFADWSHILFDQATLAEGGQLDDPAGFVRRLNEVMLALAGRTASRIWTPNS
jgi:molecular chaperone HtpG